MTKTIIVRLPDEMHKAFRLATVERGENMTDVIRRAIAGYFEEEGNKMKATYEKMNEDDYLALAHQYPGQSSPCGVYLYLDLEDGTVRVDWDAEIGNAVSEAEWNGRVRSWSMHQVITPRLANEIVEEAMPYLQAVLDDSEVKWDGSNNVGVMGGKAHEASKKIERIIFDCIENDGGNHVYFCDASEWIEDCTAEDFSITAETTDEEIVEIAQEQVEMAANHGDATEGACIALDLEEMETALRELRDGL